MTDHSSHAGQKSRTALLANRDDEEARRPAQEIKRRQGARVLSAPCPRVLLSKVCCVCVCVCVQVDLSVVTREDSLERGDLLSPKGPNSRDSHSKDNTTDAAPKKEDAGNKNGPNKSGT
jgi:hypothetical protein